MNRRHQRVTDERGSIIVLLAISAPVLLLFVALVVDVGDWYGHKRHLQIQADAGVLAAASYFNECISSPGTATADIEGKASQYAGDPSYVGTRFNQPDTGGTNLAPLYNSKTYAIGGPPPDDTDTAAPCTAKMLDLKLTLQNLGWFLFPSRFVPAINAHARVEIREVTVQNNSLPFAVPLEQPNYASATFVREDTGAALTCGAGPCTVALTKNTAISPLNGLDIWDNSLTPLSVPIPTLPAGVKIGVRIKLNESTDPAAACGGALVGCYLGSNISTNEGVVPIRAWSSAPSNTCTSASNCPVAHDVKLLPGSCLPDAYFAQAPCTFGVQADIDFTDHPINSKTTVTAVVNGNSYNLTHGSGNTWISATTNIPTSSIDGADVTLNWSWAGLAGTTWRTKSCVNGGNNPCVDSGSFGVVHRSFVGDLDPDGSGPIQLAEVGESGVSLSGANTFQQGTTHRLVVRVGVTTLANATAYNSATVLLRIASHSGSHNQAINCDPSIPGITLRIEIANGCQTPYQLNPSRVCPDSSSPYADCAPLWTGDKVGQVKQGMDDHFAPGGTCSPNNWQPPGGDPTKLPNIDPGDPRVVPLIVTTFAAFQGSGNGLVPVVNFATFYVTGWTGSNCSGNEPAPPGSRPNSADVWGHFIKIVLPPGHSSGGTLCDFTSFGNCTAVMTR